MKRILIFAIFFLTTVFTFGSTGYAACSLGDADNASSGPASPIEFLTDCAGDSPGAVTGTSGQGKEGVQSLVIKVAERAIQFGALFAIGMIVYAGIQYIISAGDDEKLKKAKNTAIYSLIGLILLGIAFPLVDVIVNFFYSLQSQ